MSLPATPPVLSVTSTAANLEQRDLLRWQLKLLPFMACFLTVLAIAFFAITLADGYEMRDFVKNEATADIYQRVNDLLQTDGSRSSANVDLAQQALLLLEADALDKRYRQASALLLSRLWTRQLAFLTGMVMAFIGAVFILGKLSESKAAVTVGAPEWKAGISSASPGLILAFFGTTLMGIALVVQPATTVQDQPMYIVPMNAAKNPGSANADTSSVPDRATKLTDRGARTSVTGSAAPQKPQVSFYTVISVGAGLAACLTVVWFLWTAKRHREKAQRESASMRK